jgi:hypothetical protein
MVRKNGKEFWRIWVHHVANPPKILATKVRRLWRDVRGEFGLAHFSNGLWFFDDFSKLT